ncbi:MAG: NAD(P)-dependent oxidoreductase [Rhodobacter sp.]|nr:NAD(P)-dependent oxidoreductase [Rhodobacter sp.]
MQIGVVGTGAMGAAMAGHINAAGHDVIAFDTDADALAAAAVDGIVAARDLSDIARAEVVIVMVANDDQSRSVVAALLGAGQAAGSVIAIAATNHPKTMIELAGLCAESGVGFVDAPVCYGLQGAIHGNLISLCGGTDDDIARVTPALETYSRSVEHLGPVGSGQLGKTCNNMMHWAACVANYEVLALAKSCGIDAQAMRETLLKCPARNTTLERWDTSKFTWHQKDMDVALDLSQQAGVPLPLFGLVDQLVKRLGPTQVRQLLHEDQAEYLGLPIPVRPLDEVTRS